MCDDGKRMTSPIWHNQAVSSRITTFVTAYRSMSIPYTTDTSLTVY